MLFKDMLHRLAVVQHLALHHAHHHLHRHHQHPQSAQAIRANVIAGGLQVVLVAAGMMGVNAIAVAAASMSPVALANGMGTPM